MIFSVSGSMVCDKDRLSAFWVCHCFSPMLARESKEFFHGTSIHEVFVSMLLFNVN